MQGLFASVSPDLAIIKKTEYNFNLFIYLFVCFKCTIPIFFFQMRCCIFSTAIIPGKLDYAILMTHYRMNTFNTAAQCEAHTWIK